MQPYGENGNPNIPTAAAYGYGNAAQTDNANDYAILLKDKREVQEEKNQRIKKIFAFNIKISRVVEALLVVGTLTGSWVFLGPPATLTFAIIYLLGFLIANKIL